MSVLEGIRVIELAQFISGSRCTQLLADMGAEVVHVEPPEGQTLRIIFSLVPGAERGFSVFNRNKYGLAIDFRKPEGSDVIKRLISKTDVFVHNHVPGSLEKYGLGYDELRKIKENLIHISISGFGETGVNPERVAFDIITQATSGHFWNDQNGLRTPTNYWADFTAGAYAANAVLLALIHRMKTGKGQHIDMSMQDVLYFSNYRAMLDRAIEPSINEASRKLGRMPKDVLNSDDRMPFYGFFKTSDGKVAIVAITSRQWNDLAAIVGKPELKDNPKYNNLISQIHNHNEAVAMIEEWTVLHTSAQVVGSLEKRKIPCGTAYTCEQVNNDENLKSRGMLASTSHPQFGQVDIPGIPYKFSDIAGSIRMPGPGLGEHNQLILRDWLGYSDQEMAELRKKKIIN
jgi:crotonobetainyl-CoA:carnitine CoA-transferase CaiB-like acyl-CoA transferase